MHKILPYILFLLSLPLTAQQMQWASQVTDKSSEYGREVYSARQALGLPNAVAGTSTENQAWAPAKEESSLGEHLHLRYTVPMRISQVVVVQSKNPGALRRITAFDTNRKRHILYDNDNPQRSTEPNFVHTFPLTDYLVSEILLELKTSAVNGSNHIDAVGISPSDTPFRGLQVEEVSYAYGVSAAENLGLQINSSFAERLPIISPDGNTLYFARKWHPQNRGDDAADDIWVSYLRGSDTWSRPVNPGSPLNNELHNFVFAVSPAGDKLWLANEYNSVAKDGISYSVKNGRTWSRPKNVRINDHYNHSPFVCYHISADEQVLLMSVKRNEGLGENDLYVSFRMKNGQFSQPQSLGPTINTVSDESSIFLAADGKTIYFSSNGHPGYGGYDMYMAQRLDKSWKNWSAPVNLGKNINTPANDYNYTLPARGDYAYFSRDDASGMSDLYRIKLPREVQPEPVVLLKGQLLDASTRQPVGGVFKYDKGKSRTRSVVSDDRGQFAMVLPYGENVELYAEREGYFAVSEQIVLDAEIEELDSDGGRDDTGITSDGNTESDKIRLQLHVLEDEITRLENLPPPVFSLPEAKRGFYPYASDPVLQDLQRRYEARYRFLTENTEGMIADGVPLTEKRIPNEEDELTRMKRKFNEENGRSPRTTEERTPVLSGKGNTRRDETEDAELAAMKAKFNKHNNRTETQPHTPVRNSGLEYFPWEIVEEKTRRETAANLLPQVRRELQQDLLQDTKDELAQEFSPRERETLQRLRPQLPTDNLLTPRGGLSTNDTPAWAEEIKQELRTALENDVRRELRRELRDEVIAELRRELTYQVKKELEEELRTDLQHQLAEEMQAEQNRVRSAPQSPVSAAAAPESVEKVYREPEVEILLAPVTVGQVIPLNNIFFDSNRTVLKSESNKELARVAAFLNEKSNLLIEIGGHTNGWCSHVFANELSADRAETVRQYLIQNGIAPERIQSHGYGKTNPIADNDTKDGRRKNQRVEMKILEVR